MKRTLIIVLLTTAFLTACGRPSNVYVTQKTYPNGNTKNTTSAVAQPGGRQTETPRAECDIVQATVRSATASYGGTYLIVEYGIKNTGNINLYLNADQFDVIGPDGSLLDVISYLHTSPTVIAPGETGYITGKATSVDYDTDNVTVEPHFNILAATISYQRLEITNTSMSEQKYGGGATIKGFVENTTNEKGIIYVYVMLFNKKGDLIGSGLAFLTLTLDRKKGFEVNADLDGYTYTDIDHYEVVSEPLHFQF